MHTTQTLTQTYLFALTHKHAGGQGSSPGAAAASLVSAQGGDVGLGYGGMDASAMIGPQAMAGMAPQVRLLMFIDVLCVVCDYVMHVYVRV